MKIVFVLGSYLPECSAVGNCIKNLVDVLQDEHEITVLCHARNRGELSRERIGSYDVLRVHTWIQDNKADAEAMPTTIQRSIKLLALRSMRAASIALPPGSTHPALVRAFSDGLESLAFEPDILVPTCLPFEALLASSRYARVRPSVRLVPFLFDQFADSKTINKPPMLGRIKRRANIRLEREALERADGVLNITWDDHVRECLPEFVGKFIHVEHPLLTRGSTAVSCVGHDLVYAGALDPVIRNPAFTLEVLSHALAGGKFGVARFFVPGYEKFAACFDSIDSTVIKLLPSVPSNNVCGILSEAEWLLSIGNTTSAQKVSKIYEYMAYGKPIVHVSSRVDDEVSIELSRYPLACCLFEEDGLEFCVNKLLEFLGRTRGASISFDEVAAIFTDELPSTVAKTLIEVGQDNGLYESA